MRSRSDLFRFQSAFAARLARDRVKLLMVELGYGKTATTLTALRDMNEWPALVVAPPKVAKKVWPEEAAQWEHTKNLLVTPLVGTPDQRLKALQLESHIETISYQNLVWLSDAVEINRRYRAIIFDELTELKTADTKRFRRMRAPVRGCMGVPIRIGLTGTPVPHHLLDLWGQAFMVAGDAALGPSFGEYRDRYFTSDYMGYKWTIRPGAEAEIHQRLRPWCLSIPPQPEVKVPQVHIHRIQVELPEDVAASIRELKDQCWTELPSGVELEALSASAVAGKARQLASGAVLWQPPAEVGVARPAATVEHVHDEKLDALDEALESLGGEPTLVAYWYQHEDARIAARLEKSGRRWGRAADQKSLDAWNRGELEVLLIHPQGAGHGLNLQHGGHHTIWYTLPFSNALFKQTNGRLARVGQKAPLVNAHALLAGVMDEAVLQLLTGQAATEGALLRFLQAE
jgi:hypothetical protein